jgi:D-lactate dehydrogenase
MKVVVYDTHKFEIETLTKAASGKLEFEFIDTRLSLLTAPIAAGAQAVCIFVNDDASAPVIERLYDYGVRFIALRCAGHNHVDLKRATELGVKVSNVPEYSPHSVAEHAVMMMLALNRKVIQANRRIMELNFSLDGLTGFDMNKKVVGIVGLGKIGQVVARILHGFGCQLLGYDLYPDDSLTERYGIRYVSLDELCAISDIVTLHVPLAKGTWHMINDDRLARMKSGAMLINTSRGGLVDTKAVIVSLKARHLGYLGIDVCEEEGGLFFEDHSSKDHLHDDAIARLMTFKNVLITSHQAFLTSTALENIADTTVQNLVLWEQGERAAHELSA